MVYTANWGIICHLPPFRGTRNNHWDDHNASTWGSHGSLIFAHDEIRHSMGLVYIYVHESCDFSAQCRYLRIYHTIKFLGSGGFLSRLGCFRCVVVGISLKTLLSRDEPILMPLSDAVSGQTCWRHLTIVGRLKCEIVWEKMWSNLIFYT